MMNGFIGTYTDGPLGRAKGVYSFSLNIESGEVEHLALIAECANPSYLALSPSKQRLYAVHEGANGEVSAYALDPDGQVRFINKQSSQGVSPCHVIVDKAATYALVSNYMNGTLSVFPLDENGALGEACQVIRFSGHGVNKERQEGPHAHFFMFDVSGEYGFAVDLGTDRLMAYSFDKSAAQPLAPLQWECARAGSGPRHGVFHPQLNAAYIVHELDYTIDVLTYPGPGRFYRQQTVSTLPQGVLAPNSTTAAIKLSPDARYLYASNRGHDSIAVYRVNTEGTLTPVDVLPCGGKTPRDFAIDPTGSLLLVCNQDSDTLVVFRIDRETGLFLKKGEYPLPSGTCVVFC
jgi:6-phosphogluconolactonase